ncbi:MAG: hypothetical protein QXO84_01400 [Candidatus Aenigmatarchaeota archaeon]
MKYLAALVVSLVLATMVVSLVAADVAVGGVGASAGPGDQTPRICVYDRNITIGANASLGSGASINPFDYRVSSYAFTGEQIQLFAIVRDPNGALDIGWLKARVGGNPEVVCNPVSLPKNMTCNGMGEVNLETDKAFECLITVEPQWYGYTEVKLTAYNSANVPTDGTHVETWYFNPVLSLSVSTNDGQPIRFEPLPYGADTPEERTVHSLNRLQVRNTAEGGVNMWMYIAATDLYDPNGASKCPDTNKIDVETYMKYRGWSGSQWQGEDGWRQMTEYNQNAQCVISWTENTCYGGSPLTFRGNGLSPSPADNILTNGGLAEVEFKLTYPMPCIGTFTQGQIMVFGKAI